jgi:cellulose biosynthesis protein BcsQ
MTIIISGIARKGGVTKTTTITNLAAACAREDLLTVVLETDGQGNATSAMGLDPRDDFHDLVLGGAEWEHVLRPVNPLFTGIDGAKLFVVSASNATRLVEVDRTTPQMIYEKLNMLRGWADVILVDTSPGITEVHTGVYISSDYVIIPSLCELDALNGVQQTFEFLARSQQIIEERNLGLKPAKLMGILPNRAQNRHKATSDVRRMMAMMFSNRCRIFDSISDGVAWREARNRYMSIFAHQENMTSDYDRTSARTAVNQFRPVAEEVTALVRKSLEARVS